MAAERVSRRGLTAGLVGVCGAFLACYVDVLRQLFRQWWTNDVYSYAFLIPVVSVYLVWTKRHSVAAALGHPSYLIGVPVLALGLSMLVIGRAGSLGLLEEFSIVAALTGMVLLAGGVGVARILWLPLTYLSFAIPVWDVFTNRLHPPFQLLAARIGEAFLNLCQVPAYRTGTFLHLPSVTLEIARECSGVNYLIAIVAVAVPYAYLSMSGAARRIAVVAFAILVAVVSNGVRVALIGVLQYYGFSQEADLHGPNHVLQGMFVAVVGYATLFAGAWVIRERPGRPAADIRSLRQPPDPVGRGRQLWQPLIAVTGLLALGALVRPIAQPAPVAIAGLDGLPSRVSSWLSDAGQAARSAVRAERPDGEWSREYRSGDGTIQLYVGYFASQREGRKLVGTGGANLPVSAAPVSISGADGRRVDVAEAEVAAPGGRRRRVIAWYNLNGRIVASDYAVKLLTVWNAVLHRRSNGAVVVLTLDSASAGDGVRAQTILRQFAADVMPATERFLLTER